MNIVDPLAGAFVGTFQSLWFGIVEYVPTMLVAILIFIIGWLVGAAIQQIVEQVFKSLKFDASLRGTGIHEAVERAGFQLNSGKFIGGLVRWFIVVGFLVVSLDLLQLNQVNAFIGTVVLSYLPNVIIASLLILVGAVVAQFVGNIVAGSARAAEIHSASFAGAVAKYAVWIFVVITAVEQLGLENGFIQTLYTGIVVAIALALGLSFGLGGQEAAAKFIDKVKNDLSHK